MWVPAAIFFTGEVEAAPPVAPAAMPSYRPAAGEQWNTESHSQFHTYSTEEQVCSNVGPYGNKYLTMDTERTVVDSRPNPTAVFTEQLPSPPVPPVSEPTKPTKPTEPTEPKGSAVVHKHAWEDIPVQPPATAPAPPPAEATKPAPAPAPAQQQGQQEAEPVAAKKNAVSETAEDRLSAPSSCLTWPAFCLRRS